MSYSSNREKQTQTGNFRSFLPFVPLKTPKIKLLKKEKQFMDKSYDHNHMMYSSWDKEWDRQHFLSLSFLMILNIIILKKMKKIPEDIIILLYIHVYHKWRSYDIGFLKSNARQTEIFNILNHFLPFQPLYNRKNQNLNIEKSTWRYYYTLCTTNDNHIMYGSWDMERNHLNHFLLFYSPMDYPKKFFSNKYKEYLKILSFYKHKWQS